MNKLKKILIVIMVFLSFQTNVKAETTSVDELIEVIKTTETYNAIFPDADITNDKENKIIKLTDETKSISFNYNDEYIYRENRNFVVTEENYAEDLPYMFLSFTMIIGNIKASGYDEETALRVIDNITKNISEIDYETYGIEYETENYNYSGKTETGGTWSAEGYVMKYFRLLLDNNKVEQLVEEYGTSTEDDEENNGNYDLQPTVRVDNITENNITIYPKVEGYQGEEYPKCFIYRSDSEDGEYNLVSESSVNCDGTIGITDKNLEEGKTYYYKARLEDGYKLSDAVSATTLSNTVTEKQDEEITEKTDEEITENVPTGDILFIFVWIIGIAALGYLIYFIINKKSKKTLK